MVILRLQGSADYTNPEEGNMVNQGGEIQKYHFLTVMSNLRLTFCFTEW